MYNSIKIVLQITLNNICFFYYNLFLILLLNKFLYSIHFYKPN